MMTWLPVVLIVTALAILVCAVIQAKRPIHPVIAALHAAGVRPNEAVSQLCARPAWQRCDTLMTLREQHFFRALLKNIDTRQWYLCPQVRVADIVRLGGHIRPQSRAWWQLFRMASQWHCDVVIIDKNTFGIIAAVELDDASHLQVRRVRRDILLAEVLRQAGIPLIRHHDSQILLKQINQFLQGKTKGMKQVECADI